MLMIDYLKTSAIFKTLSEPTRLKILDMLSCGELCACEILESLSITQPTLSHHMKVLIECGLVLGRKDATWMHYSISKENVGNLHLMIDHLMKTKKDCICGSVRMNCNHDQSTPCAGLSSVNGQKENDSYEE